tara:strand:- start:370 stop:597 length:228 start_codon:yes stop_codon:yes gene_type:complete
MKSGYLLITFLCFLLVACGGGGGSYSSSGGSNPIYQFSSDLTSSVASGDTLNSKWFSVLPDGTTTNNLGYNVKSR